VLGKIVSSIGMRAVAKYQNGDAQRMTNAYRQFTRAAKITEKLVGWRRQWKRTIRISMLGNLHQFPNAWIVIGLFYPPHQTTRDLFFK
jgi:hypothetical protein